MAIEQLDKLLVRSDPVGGGPVVPALRPQTFLYEQQKHRQTTPGSSIKNWLRIRTVLNLCTGRPAKRLLRRISGLLVAGGVAYLGFLALVDDFRPVDPTRIIPADEQQAIIPSDQHQAIMPSDEQQATISSRSAHDAPAVERASYSLTSTPSDVAIEPVKSSALVSPDRNTTVPTNDGGYVVQVSAERSDAKAQASFKTLQSRYPHVLGGRSPLIRRVELGENGIFYRAQIGPFDTVEQAKQLCARLKSAGGRCMVQKNS
jgi:cell division septation protein DedD